jgi:hypothetical protein
MARQFSRALEIIKHAINMLPSVELHDQSRSHTNKINHESSDG